MLTPWRNLLDMTNDVGFLTHRVISRQRSFWIAFGASGHDNFMNTRPSAMFTTWYNPQGIVMASELYSPRRARSCGTA